MDSVELQKKLKRDIIITSVVTATVGAAVVVMDYIPKRLVDFAENDALRVILLKRLYNGVEINCFNQLRMGKEPFKELCHILRTKGLVCDTQYVSLEESVALFLYILAHNKKFRDVGGMYLRSIDTISRHFTVVLRAILRLAKDYIKLPESKQEHKSRWFEDCVGALDGTHFQVSVPIEDQGRYRNRKQAITTNVLGVRNSSMKFLYVLSGWEGSSSDSRVQRDALERQDRFEVPTGKYYLVDAGYTNGLGFLAPYRSTRYHLKEWSIQGYNPTNYKELFN